MRTISTFLVLCILNTISFSQQQDSIAIQNELNKAKDLQNSYKSKEAFDVLKKLAPRVKDYYGQHSKETAVMYYQMASTQLDLAAYEEARIHLEKALAVFKLIDSVSMELGNTYMLLGIYYDYMSDYDKALAYYELTKSIYLKLLPLNDYRFGYLYSNMGICIFYKGDIERTLTFFNKTLAINSESLGEKHTKISNDILNLSQCHSKLKKPNIALEKLDIALKLAQYNNVYESSLGARVRHAMGLAYIKLKEYEKAKDNFDAALALRLKYLPETHPEIGANYFVIANIFEETNELEHSKKYYQKALKIFVEVFGKDHPEVATAHNKLAAIYLKKNDINTALHHINRSISIFNYDGNIPLTENDKFDLNVLSALDIKAKILYELWKSSKNIFQLKKADHIYTDLIFVLNEFRKGFKEELSKQILAGDFFHVFENAIDVSHSLFKETQNTRYLKEGFKRYEYSTSFVLLEGRRNTKAQVIAEIPDSLLQVEQQLNIDITTLEKRKREEEKNKEKDSNEILSLASKIFDLKEASYKLNRTFERNYPRYLQFKNDLSIVDISKLQHETLEPDQTLIEYFIGKKNIFVFVITKEIFLLEKIEKNFPIEFWVEDLRKKITKFQFPFNLNDDYHDILVKRSESLYQKLIAPFEHHFTNRLIIVPGGVLAEVPFECLIKKRGSESSKYKEHHYLVQDYAISYCYSGTLLFEMVSNRNLKSNHKTIAFAPTFNSFGKSSNLRDLLLHPLQYNTSEVQDISAIMGAETIIGEEATEDNFIKLAPKYSILHFATHAKADNNNSDFSFLAFTEVYDTIENELLFVKDLYNLQLRSEMVTLSACQTGIGENRKGEGIISLARGFSYAGTGNINTSLWNVEDSKTAKLMKLFYQNIADGISKDEALKKAKLSFISSYSNNMQVHPFFWTAMISIGDMQSIDVPWQPNSLLLVFAFTGLLVFFLWFWRFKKTV